VTPIAAESILLGQLGEIKAGQEIPSSYPGTMGDEVKTDFKRLKALGLIADEKPMAKAEPEGKPEPKAEATTPDSKTNADSDDGDELPAGVKDLGSGWYEVDGEKIRGRDAAIAAAKKG
jgi:hypothetical protein